MQNLITSLWNYKIQLAPVALSFILFEFVGRLRKWKHLPYSPMYFSLYPLSGLNEELAKYYGEALANSLNEAEAEKLRKEIIRSSILSFALTAIGIPLITGFVCAFFLNPSLLAPFLLMLVIYKAYEILRSLIHFHAHTIATSKNIILTSLIYVIYLGMAVEMFRTAFNWAIPFIETSNWGGMFSALSAIVFGKILAGIIISSVLVGYLTTYITDRQLRDELNPPAETSK